MQSASERSVMSRLSACLLLNLQPSFMCGFRAALFQNLGSWHRLAEKHVQQFPSIPIKCDMFVEFPMFKLTNIIKKTCAFSQFHMLAIRPARPRGSRRSWDFLADPSAPSAAVVT